VEAGELAAEAAVGAVTGLQELVRSLGRPAVLARLDEMRRRLERRLGEWSHAAFVSARIEVEQRLGAGNLSGAVQAAKRLQERAQAATYPDAAYDRAVAGVVVGRALKEAGRASEALPSLRQAEQSFTELAGAGDQDATRMLLVVATECGDALRDLGRLEQAAESHQKAQGIAERLGDLRSAAVSRAQLGFVRLLQGRLRDALDVYEQSRQTFEALREPQAVAISWHQIGMVHEAARRWDLAEAAYQNSLHIKVELGDKRGQAATLSQMGNLYRESGLPEQAAQLHRQTATLREELGDAFRQARSLKNLADTLRALGRLDEARETATWAARLEAPFGFTAEPWKTWDILRNIETTAGHPDAVVAAGSRAMELYAVYRRKGGAPMSPMTRLIAAAGQVLRERGPEEARRLIPPPEGFEQEVLPLRDALLAIVDGSRDPGLAEDTRLNYEKAVEILLLISSLGASKPSQT
jgi:tetratricopeptide (TPR) repeat protein